MTDPTKAALLEAALRYASAGHVVFPGHSVNGDGHCSCGRSKCGSPAKHPRIREWQKHATTDDTAIRRWWSRWPSANVCLATGRKSGLIVVDVDPRHDGEASLAALSETHCEFSETPTVRTGGGGLHFFFQCPDQGIPNRVGILPGIDIRGDGGFVVAPPSLHISRQVYQWIRPLTA